MIDHEVLECFRGEYEDGREESKLGMTGAILMVTKAVISLSIFGFHSIFLRSGYLLGSIVSIIYMAGTGYGCIRASTLAAEVENSRNIKGYYVETYFELGEIIFPKNSNWRYLFGPALFVLNLLAMTSVSIAAFLALQMNIIQFLHFTQLGAKLLIYATVIVIILLIAEPERLKFIAYVALVPVIFLNLTCPTIALHELSGDKSVASGLKAIDFANLSQSIGYSISALEIIGYILNIRRMIKDKRDFLKACYISFSGSALLNIIPAVIMYMRFGLELQGVQLYFKKYSNFNVIVFFDYLLNCSFLYTLPSKAYFSMELFEKTKLSRYILRDKDSNLIHWKVVCSRIFYFTCVALLTIPITDIQVVYAMTGVVVNSFLGLIIPGLLGILRPIDIRDPDESRITRVLDYCLIMLGMNAFLLYVYERT